MLGVERGDQLLETSRRERRITERARQLEALVLVAEIGSPLEPLTIARDLLPVEPRACLRLEPDPGGVQPRQVGTGRAALGDSGRAHEGRADVGVEEAPR